MRGSGHWGTFLFVPDAVQRVALAISSFTRVFDALWRCTVEPGPSRTPALGTVPVLRSITPKRGVLHRARDTIHPHRSPPATGPYPTASRFSFSVRNAAPETRSHSAARS